MAEQSNHVCPNKPLSKSQVSKRLAMAWSRIWPKIGKGRMADEADTNTRTIDRVLTGDHLPEAQTIFNALVADETALDEILGEYGFLLRRKNSDAANDMDLAAGLGHSVAELIDRLKDGHRCHVDTAILGALFRELIPQMQAVVDEADAMRRSA